jgi:hypothetical protein
MADNITALANTGTGTDVFATDDIGGVNYPRSKTGFGVDGQYHDVSHFHPLPTASDPRLETLITLMARAVKLLDSNATVDNAQRQRIVIDAGTITTVSTVSTVTTVSTVSAVNNVVANAGMDREQYINISKQTMAQGIRSRLTFA